MSVVSLSSVGGEMLGAVGQKQRSNQSQADNKLLMCQDFISILQVEIRGRDGFGQEAKHWLRVSLPSPGASMDI